LDPELYHAVLHAQLEDLHAPGGGRGHAAPIGHIESALMQKAFDHMAVEIPVAKIRNPLIAECRRGEKTARRVIDGDQPLPDRNPRAPARLKRHDRDDVAPWPFAHVDPARIWRTISRCAPR
jgi:hypothetical protein